MADTDRLEGFSADYETARRAVEDYGMSLIALLDYVGAPKLSELLGVDYRGVLDEPPEMQMPAIVVVFKKELNCIKNSCIIPIMNQAYLSVIP